MICCAQTHISHRRAATHTRIGRVIFIDKPQKTVKINCSMYYHETKDRYLALAYKKLSMESSQKNKKVQMISATHTVKKYLDQMRITKTMHPY